MVLTVCACPRSIRLWIWLLVRCRSCSRLGERAPLFAPSCRTTSCCSTKVPLRRCVSLHCCEPTLLLLHFCSPSTPMCIGCFTLCTPLSIRNGVVGSACSCVSAAASLFAPPRTRSVRNGLLGYPVSMCIGCCFPPRTTSKYMHRCTGLLTLCLRNGLHLHGV